LRGFLRSNELIMTSSISTISTATTSSNTVIQQPEFCDCFLTQKIRDIYQKHVVENKYLNEVFHYFFKGIGFTLGAVFVLWAAKDIIIEIFRNCMRR
jgi:hypothetical protein